MVLVTSRMRFFCNYQTDRREADVTSATRLHLICPAISRECRRYGKEGSRGRGGVRGGEFPWRYARQSAKAWYRFSDSTFARPLPALRTARAFSTGEITSAPFGNVYAYLVRI